MAITSSITCAWAPAVPGICRRWWHRNRHIMIQQREDPVCRRCKLSESASMGDVRVDQLGDHLTILLGLQIRFTAFRAQDHRCLERQEIRFTFHPLILLVILQRHVSPCSRHSLLMAFPTHFPPSNLLPRQQLTHCFPCAAKAEQAPHTCTDSPYELPTPESRHASCCCSLVVITITNRK